MTRGYIRTAAQQYLIEPMSGTDDGDHALSRYEALNEDPAVCGVTNSSWDPIYPPTGRTRSRSSVRQPSHPNTRSNQKSLLHPQSHTQLRHLYGNIFTQRKQNKTALKGQNSMVSVVLSTNESLFLYFTCRGHHSCSSRNMWTCYSLQITERYCEEQSRLSQIST